MEQPEDAVVETLRELGLDEEAVARAMRCGDPEGAIFEQVLLPQQAERTVTAREVEEAGGPPVEQIQEWWQAYGLPIPEPDTPAFSPEEAESFKATAAISQIFTQDLQLEAARVHGRLLARIAQAEVQLLRVYVEPRLREQAGGRVEALPQMQALLGELLPISEQILRSIHRRWLEHELAQFAVSAAEEDAAGRPLPGSVEVALLFCDLKDFTAFATRAGDAEAIAAIDRFTAVTVRERGDRFRLSKSLGDGVMLVYGDVHEAVDVGRRVVDAHRDPDTPGIHASVHHGVAIAREGDYFGGAVNLAARLLAAARRDELVGTREVVEATGAEFSWKPVGAERFRGVEDPVDLFLLDP